MEAHLMNGINEQLKLTMLVVVVVAFGKTDQFTLLAIVLSICLIYAKNIAKVSFA